MDVELVSGSGDARVIAMARRGMADGKAGRPMASDDPVYARAHESANLLRRARAGEILLAMSEGASCRRCNVVFFGPVGACGCGKHGPQALQRGIFAAYGEGVESEVPGFLPLEHVRVLIGTGLAVYGRDGENITAQIAAHQ